MVLAAEDEIGVRAAFRRHGARRNTRRQRAHNRAGDARVGFRVAANFRRRIIHIGYHIGRRDDADRAEAAGVFRNRRIRHMQDGVECRRPGNAEGGVDRAFHLG